ncbi:helix-turn-helix transcriptional regulator [Tenacibaculum aestuariivivum]|uniref:helix-turn-helix transcriptional regulator n=1 Tax=Tenacibaculum aestuariivivum TaxID=2006131 RepID=UPI003AB18A00
MDLLTRLKQIIDYYNLTSSTFADAIDVQRSSISHLLSGRNKPSLDFVMKIVNKFPEVDLYWFLYGEGVFPKIVKENIIENNSKSINEENTLFSENSLFDKTSDKITNTQFSENKKKLIKIVLLYSDGSFEEFNK